MNRNALLTLALMSGVQGAVPTGEPVSQFQDVLHHKFTETPQQAQKLKYDQNVRDMKGNIASLASVGIAGELASQQAQHMHNLARRAEKARKTVKNVHWGDIEVNDGRIISFDEYNLHRDLLDSYIYEDVLNSDNPRPFNLWRGEGFPGGDWRRGQHVSFPTIFGGKRTRRSRTCRSKTCRSRTRRSKTRRSRTHRK